MAMYLGGSPSSAATAANTAVLLGNVGSIPNSRRTSILPQQPQAPPNYYVIAASCLPPIIPGDCTRGLSVEQVRAYSIVLFAARQSQSAARLLLNYGLWDEALVRMQEFAEYPAVQQEAFHVLLRDCLRHRATDRLEQLWRFKQPTFGILEFLAVVASCAALPLAPPGATNKSRNQPKSDMAAPSPTPPGATNGTSTTVAAASFMPISASPIDSAFHVAAAFRLASASHQPSFPLARSPEQLTLGTLRTQLTAMISDTLATSEALCLNTTVPTLPVGSGIRIVPTLQPQGGGAASQTSSSSSSSSSSSTQPTSKLKAIPSSILDA